MKLKVPLKNLLLGNLIVVVILLFLFTAIGDVFHLFELKTLDTRYILRDMTGNNPTVHKDIINVNIANAIYKTHCNNIFNKSKEIWKWINFQYGNVYIPF